MEIKLEINKFIDFVQKKIQLESIPKIHIKDNRNGLSTLANYEIGGAINVYGKDRLFIDVLRSLAHELVHHRQYELGMLSGKIQDIGGKIEDSANAIAGRLVKEYSYQNKYIFDIKL